MRKKSLLKIAAGAAVCLSLTVAPINSQAASPADAAALARSLGLPEDLIQAGWNRYYESPELYPPELIDSYMEVLRGMSQDMINQLITDNGFTPGNSQTPVATTAPAEQPSAPTVTTAAPNQGNHGNSGGNGNSGASGSDSEKNDHITLTLPDGSTFTRISAKEFAALSLEEKKAYIATFSPEQQNVILSNLSPEEYRSLLQQMSVDDKADVINDVTQITNSLGLTLSVDDITDDNFTLSMRDETGKLVAVGSAKDTVAKTGYDRRGIFAAAAALIAAGAAGMFAVAKKCFRKEENNV